MEVLTEPLSIIFLLLWYLGRSQDPKWGKKSWKEDSGSSKAVSLSSVPGKGVEQIILDARKTRGSVPASLGLSKAGSV